MNELDECMDHSKKNKIKRFMWPPIKIIIFMGFMRFFFHFVVSCGCCAFEWWFFSFMDVWPSQSQFLWMHGSSSSTYSTWCKGLNPVWFAIVLEIARKASKKTGEVILWWLEEEEKLREKKTCWDEFYGIFWKIEIRSGFTVGY